MKFVKIDNIMEWSKFDLSKTLVLHGNKKRRIRLELNPSDPIRVSLLKGATRNEMVFLANVDQPTTLDFIDEGNIHVVVNPLFDGVEPDVYYYTADGQHTHSEEVDRKVFTRMHVREARDPRLEALTEKMYQNMERRFAQLDRDQVLRDRELKRIIERQREAEENGQEPAGTTSSTSGPDVSEPDAGAGAENSAGPDGGTKPVKPKGSLKS